ncbi:MAG: GAF domain-containing protein [Chloroflexi bacterium]|nr:GAF domain-containing protein [Chloroflexota bacterium]
MQEANEQEDLSLREELDYIRRLTVDLRNVLKQQREVLKESGFRLPPGTTTTLSDIARRLEGALNRLSVLEEERDQYRALADTAALINSSLDLTQVLNEVMDTIIGLTHAERGYLMLRNEETRELEFRIARNMDRTTLDNSAFEVSRNVVNRVAESGEALLTTNAQEDPRFQNSESIVSYSLRSILCVPLTLKEQVTGVIYTDNKIHAGLFTEQTRDLLMAFANQAAVALQNASLFERVTSSLEAISELKYLQDNVFASIASGVITADHDNKITLINRRAQQIFGLLESVDNGDLVGTTLDEVLPPLDSRFERIMRDALSSDKSIQSVEFETELSNRGRINLNMNLSPLKDAHETTQGVAIVLDDMTDVKRREAQLAGVRRYLPPDVVDYISSPAALKLGGTRQVISILFADIRGFSTFSEVLDPEKLVEITNTYMTIASDAIQTEEGIIDKFMGDAVMALYNTSLRPQADHALRAVRAATVLIDEVKAFHESVPEGDRLEFGVGVHTGEAVVGNVGSPERLDYTAMGDTVNLAKRLQEVAQPSQILISDNTYELIKDAIEVNELEPVQVKGRKQLTQVYEVIRVR